MSYLDNINSIVSQGRKKARLQRDVTATCNRANKLRKRHTPRGRAYKRMQQIALTAAWKKLKEEIQDILLTTAQ